MFQWQKFHIFEDLAAHEIEIEILNPLTYATVEEANAALLKRLKQGGIDLFMTTCTHKDLYIDTLNLIRQLGIPTLLICFDNLTVPYAHKEISPHFDLVWLTSIETKYLFDKWGVNSIFQPYAANPRIVTPQYIKDEERVLFIGTPYGSRCKMLNSLLSADVPISIFAKNTDISNNIIPPGNKIQLIKSFREMMSFPIGRKLAYASLKNKIMKQSKLKIDSKCLEINPPVPVNIMLRLYNEFALSLSSVTNRHTGVLKTPLLIVNLRSFEIPSAGGLLFCQFNPELNGYFENEKEALYYFNDEDMVDKAKYYLSPKRKSDRMRIKENAYIKALNEHTWFNRFSNILNAMNLKK